MGKFQEKEKVIFSENVTIYYINQKKINRNSFLIRGFHELLYSFRLMKKSKELKSNITYVASPYMFLIPLVAYGIKGKKVIDNRDLIWEYLKENSYLQKVIKQTLKFIMKKSLKCFNSVIVTNSCELKMLKNNYHLKKIIIIPNGISNYKYTKLSNILINNNSQFTVTYAGNIALGHNIKILVKVAEKLPQIRFLIIGSGTALPSIKEYVKNNQVNNIIFTDKIEWKELELYYRETSILYAQLNGEEYRMAMPSKLYEYASIGLPIIYGGIGYATTFVKKLEYSKVIKPNNIDELVSAINYIKNNYNSISTKNRLLIKKQYIRENSSKIIKYIIEQHI